MKPDDGNRDGERDAGAPSPFLDPSTAAFSDSFDGEDQPLTLDNYRIIRKLGEGGMGIVFEAEQQSPRRRVALKIIRGGPFAGRRAARLFQREIKVLARLRHPGIAAIYESGKAASGQYFYAMELASGQTLDLYLANPESAVRKGSDPVGGRLDLFQRIAAAVSYAHQRGVIHRDLKPHNILVADRDTGSETFTALHSPVEVKVLDFGLARVMVPEPGEETLFTATTGMEGTLPYMSPEQIRGNPDEVDVRTDVYSLGLILYWMICGRLPYDLQKLPLPEAVRVICEEPPKPITTALTRSGKVAPDLETIILGALDKSPARRYQSVAAMAEDIRRYLADEPIVARAPSILYQLKKMVDRHRLAASFSAALLVVVLSAGLALVLQARRVKLEAETSRRVSQFMMDLFQSGDPGVVRGRTLTVREVLETGARRMTTELKDQLEVQSRLQLAIAQALKNLSLFESARLQYEASLQTRKSLYGEDSLEAAEVYDELTDLFQKMGKYGEGVSCGEKAVAIHRKRLGKQDARTAESMHRLALDLDTANRFAEAEKLYMEAVPILEKALGPESVDLAPALNDFALLKLRMNDLAAAEPLARRSLAIRRKAYPGGHRLLAYSLDRMNILLRMRGDLSEAVKYGRESLAMREGLFGSDSEETNYSARSLAITLTDLGQMDEALALYRRVIETDRKVYGDDNARTAADLSQYGRALGIANRIDEEEAAQRRVLEITTKLYGESSREVARAWNNLAAVEVKRKNYPEAERMFQKSIALKIRLDGESHPDTAETKVSLGQAYLLQGRLREAEGLIRTGTDDMVKVFPESPRSANLLRVRADYYEKTDRPNEAERDYDQALRIVTKQLPPKHPIRLRIEKRYSEFRAKFK